MQSDVMWRKKDFKFLRKRSLLSFGSWTFVRHQIRNMKQHPPARAAGCSDQSEGEPDLSLGTITTSIIDKTSLKWLCLIMWQSCRFMLWTPVLIISNLFLRNHVWSIISGRQIALKYYNTHGHWPPLLGNRSQSGAGIRVLAFPKLTQNPKVKWFELQISFSAS